jgi:chromosome partitioning protein
MKTIALINQKGGVGKTTTAFSLGAGLALTGSAELPHAKVLLIDADPQANLTQMMGWQTPDELPHTLPTLIESAVADDEVKPGDAILHHADGLDLIPSSIELANTEVSLVTAISRETVLRRIIESVGDAYDYAIIDCMPSLGMLTVNALAAADSVIIPVVPHFLPAKGLEQLLQSISKMRRRLNPKLAVDGILLTMTDGRTNLERNIIAMIQDAYGSDIRLFKTQIPRSVRAAELAATGQDIFTYDGSGRVAMAYAAFVQELLDGIE